MARGTRAAPEKVPARAFDHKMVRQRPAFLNQETLDSVAREHQLHLQKLSEEIQLEGTFDYPERATDDHLSTANHPLAVLATCFSRAFAARSPV